MSQKRKSPQTPSPSEKPLRQGLSQGYRWDYKDHKFVGYSVAGITTSLVYENPGMVFDVAQGLPFNIPFKYFFITHGHSDHASGLPYVLSQRSLWSLPPAEIYVPAACVEPMTQIISAYQKMEGYTYEYHLKAMNHGDRVDIGKEYIVEAFPTSHRVASQGYRVFRKKKKIKPEYARLPRAELAHLRGTGVTLEEQKEEGLMAFTGDTTSDFLDTFKTPVKVLFMETTFIDEVRDIAAARYWGHVHLDEWVDRIEAIPAEKIVLIHLSARYKMARILEVLQQKIPAPLREKIEVYPRPF